MMWPLQPGVVARRRSEEAAVAGFGAEPLVQIEEGIGVVGGGTPQHQVSGAAAPRLDGGDAHVSTVTRPVAIVNRPTDIFVVASVTWQPTPAGE